jgi:hypothetical protein
MQAGRRHWHSYMMTTSTSKLSQDVSVGSITMRMPSSLALPDGL